MTQERAGACACFPGSRGDPGRPGPVRETENTGEIPVLQKAEEKKQIVTAAGKVIGDRCGGDHPPEGGGKEGGGGGSKGGRRGRLPMPLCARRSQKALCGPAAGAFEEGAWGASGQSEKEFKETAIKVTADASEFRRGRHRHQYQLRSLCHAV